NAMLFSRNAFNSVNDLLCNLLDAGKSQFKRERAKTSKKHGAPKSSILRLENLEERALLSIVPPFADSLVDQNDSSVA
ncbi:MAG: hypothetical protein J6X44_03650, partial [Thermoguttaceae bacterium]|nr:hypothetical protein [Thermoguttaceae bacterium]